MYNTIPIILKFLIVLIKNTLLLDFTMVKPMLQSTIFIPMLQSTMFTIMFIFVHKVYNNVLFSNER